jgi:hypothetical protein
VARQVEDQTAYAAGYRDPVRAANPYTPTELVRTGGQPNLPIVGVVVVAVLLLWLEHRRRRRGGR